MNLIKKTLNNRLFIPAFLAAMVALPAVVQAAPGVVTANVNVRGGPGVNYGRVATLPAGSWVDVGRCRGNWCQVGNRGYLGWVSARYVRIGAQPGAPAPIAPPYAAPPAITLFFGSGYSDRGRGYYRPCMASGCVPYRRHGWSPNWRPHPHWGPSHWEPHGGPHWGPRPYWGPGPVIGPGGLRPFHRPTRAEHAGR